MGEVNYKFVSVFGFNKRSQSVSKGYIIRVSRGRIHMAGQKNEHSYQKFLHC